MFSLDRPCSLCGHALFDGMKSPRLAHLCRCGTCGLVQVRAFPAAHELHEIYGEGYFQSENSAEMGYTDYAADRDLIVRTAHRRLEVIETLAGQGKGRLLDVGCAMGFFLVAAQRRGWEVAGVDISAHAANYARETLGLDARAGMLEDAGFEPKSCDVLTMWDVIEHVPSPVDTLRTCAGLLAEGGLIALSTPDIGSRVAKFTGPRWMGYKLAEEHLYYFSRRTMALSLERAGFEILETRSTGKDISLDFFAKRLALYAGPASKAAERGLAVTGLGTRTAYVNPRDIMFMIARKRPSA